MRKVLLLVGLMEWTVSGAFVPAPYGDVTLKGPLGTRLESMLTHHVLATDTAYITAPFLGKTERRGWWQTEFWGKYMHSAMPFWSYTKSAELRTKIDAGLANIIGSQEPCGYIGNYPDDVRCGEGWDVWGMKYTILGLLHYYDGDPASENGRKALAAAKRVCDYVIQQLGPNGVRGKRFNDGPIDEVFRRDCLKMDMGGRFLPVRSPSEDIWMSFSAALPMGSHHENPEGSNWPQIHFCDYASAANLWEPSNACRVWFPVEWSPDER